MRKQPTKYEDKLAAALRERGYTVIQQFAVHYGGRRPFHADIFLHDASLVIEVDGSHHNRTARQVMRDKKRDATMRHQGFTVLRVGNSLVHSDRQLKEFLDDLVKEHPPKIPISNRICRRCGRATTYKTGFCAVCSVAIHKAEVEKQKKAPPPEKDEPSVVLRTGPPPGFLKAQEQNRKRRKRALTLHNAIDVVEDIASRAIEVILRLVLAILAWGLAISIFVGGTAVSVASWYTDRGFAVFLFIGSCVFPFLILRAYSRATR